MGSICCNITDDEDYITSNFAELKEKLIEEYKSYLIFLNQLKLNLNSSIIEKNKISYNINNNNQNNENNQEINNKRFFLIPRVWFENWEKRVEAICKTNKYKSYDYNYYYKNEEKLPIFYYELISDDLWIKFCKNQIYKLSSEKRKTKNAIICNSLIIIHYENKYNSIEIFFFEKEEDLFFTNLLFSFENCEDKQRECYSLLALLKKSPIQEILGNMHYDKSKEFTVNNNKMIIYNKTGIYDKEIKIFREKQYDLEFVNLVHGPTSIYNEKNKDFYDNRKIGGYYDINKNTNYEGVTNIKQKNGESTVYGNDASISGVNNNNKLLLNNNLNRNISRTMKIYKNNSQFNNDNTKTFILSLKNSSLISNNMTEKEYRKNSRNMLLNPNADFSTIYDNKYKGTNIFDCFEENKNNQNFFESIIYCLYNIKELTNYFLNNKETEKKLNNPFYNEYLKIIEFLNKKKSNLINKLNNNKTNNIYNINDNGDSDEKENEKYLINLCPDYNYQKILRLIIFQNSINIISKIINTLHIELNKSSNNLNENDSKEEKIINQDEEEKNMKYQNFIKECKEKNNSIIFEMFYGIKETKVICCKCKKSYYKYELINIIEFSIEKLFKYLKEDNTNNNKNSNVLNIMDCFNYYTKEKKQNDNMVIECVHCGEYQNYSLINTICKYPEIFIICYYYDNNFQEEEQVHDIKIDFGEKIKFANDEYNLIGIISLQKNTNSNVEDEMYFAYCKDHSNKKWIFYDKNNINNFNFEKNKNNIVPVVLFYQKMKE